ncbi:phosphate ABC transporter substrate-binding protein PstS [Micromonospora sp. CPCC 205371]|nr:phosphate ABC transporter substrate-binding protein PstS [Micromonospora sp. CPCC 205371]
MSTRRLVLAAAMVAALAGCGAEPPAPTPVADGIRCAAGSLTGQGSSAQANAVNIWIRNYQAACPEAAIEYASVGSGAGLRAFLAGTGDFAGTDTPLPASDQPKADARCDGGPAIHLPMVVGPIVLAYNVAGVTGLRLSPATIAKIFAGAAATWDDPAIAADNPDVVLPSTRIRTVHRSDGSGTTNSFTAFLASTAGAGWRFGTGTTWRAPGGEARDGNGGVAAAVRRTEGAIGYLEWSYAQVNNLETAVVRNGAGQFVEVGNQAAGTAVGTATVTGTGGDQRLAVDYATTAAGAYPLVLVTYEVVCAKGTRAAAIELLRGFLAYTSSAAGQQAVARLGYAPLPDQIRTRVAATIDTLA